MAVLFFQRKLASDEERGLCVISSDAAESLPLTSSCQTGHVQEGPLCPSVIIQISGLFTELFQRIRVEIFTSGVNPV